MGKNDKGQAAAENSRTLTFTPEKVTKNALRLQEDTVEGQPPVIGSLYVQKWFTGEQPKSVTVTITVEK